MNPVLPLLSAACLRRDRTARQHQACGRDDGRHVRRRQPADQAVRKSGSASPLHAHTPRRATDGGWRQGSPGPAQSLRRDRRQPGDAGGHQRPPDSPTVSTVPSFAASWLVPRLGRFTSRHPDIEIRVEATPGLVDLSRDRVDVAIRHGLGNYPGLVSDLLMTPVFLPVASPGSADARTADAQTHRLPRLSPASGSDRADWPLWFRRRSAWRTDPRIDTRTFLRRRLPSDPRGRSRVRVWRWFRDIHAREEIAAGRLPSCWTSHGRPTLPTMS